MRNTVRMFRIPEKLNRSHASFPMMYGTWGGIREARAWLGTPRSLPRVRGRMEAKRPSSPLRCADGISQVPGNGQVSHFVGARVRGELCPGAGAAAARARRAGDRQDAARRGDRVGSEVG